MNDIIRFTYYTRLNVTFKTSTSIFKTFKKKRAYMISYNYKTNVLFHKNVCFMYRAVSYIISVSILSVYENRRFISQNVKYKPVCNDSYFLSVVWLVKHLCTDLVI